MQKNFHHKSHASKSQTPRFQTSPRGFALTEVLLSLAFLALALPLACLTSTQIHRQEEKLQLAEQSRWLIPQALHLLTENQRISPENISYPRTISITNQLQLLEPNTTPPPEHPSIHFPCPHQILLQGPHTSPTLTFYRE